MRGVPHLEVHLTTWSALHAATPALYEWGYRSSNTMPKLRGSKMQHAGTALRIQRGSAKGVYGHALFVPALPHFEIDLRYFLFSRPN